MATSEKLDRSRPASNFVEKIVVMANIKMTNADASRLVRVLEALMKMYVELFQFRTLYLGDRQQAARGIE